MLRLLKSLIQTSSPWAANDWPPTENGATMNGCTAPAVEMRPRPSLLEKYKNPSEPCTMSLGKQKSHTRNSVTVPSGVTRPTLCPWAFWSFTKDSVNQKFPSDASEMWSGLLPAVGTLNCFSFPTDGAAIAAPPSDTATAAAATATSTPRGDDMPGRRRRFVRIFVHPMNGLLLGFWVDDPPY